MTTIRESLRRVDSVGKVTGETLYPGDLIRPDMLHMKILFAGRPHARVLRVDVRQAQLYPGVVAVFTARDVPVNEYGLIIRDQPVLVGPGSDNSWGDVARFEGDQVALIVAETEKAASAARDLINIEWEELPVITDPIAAMSPDAPMVFLGMDTNILKHNRVRKGDVSANWEKCSAIVEGHYQTPWQEHAYLAPESGIAYIDNQGRVTVEVAGQWIHEEQEQIAHALGLSLDQVRVIHPAIGGAFGGREDMSVQIVLALAVWQLSQQGINRPVKIIWSREESIRGHHKRHPCYIRAKWGADAQGKVLASECDLIQDAGAYAYTSTKVLGNATLMCTGPYQISHVKVDAYAVYTNNVPGGAFRGFGGPQGAFAAEAQINKLAEQLGIDPVEMRLRNLVEEGSVGSFGSCLPVGVTIKQVVRQCAEKAEWSKAFPRNETSEHIVQGRGFACGFKNIGFSFGHPEGCWAKIELHGGSEIERVVLYNAGADVGQGAHTVMAQMTARAIGVPLNKVSLGVADTTNTGDSGSASASRLTFMSGNAIIGAADDALQQWREEERPAIGIYRFKPRITSELDPQTGECDPNITYGYVAEYVEVEVDTETGHVRVTDVICADDVGKAINIQQVEGQIEGAIVQAHGYTLLENLIITDGLIQTPYFSNYLIPTVLDVPDRVQSLILEYADPQGPWGARGMAEMPYLPYAPAVIAALHDATGVWFNEFPLTPERVLSGLKDAMAAVDQEVI